LINTAVSALRFLFTVTLDRSNFARRLTACTLSPQPFPYRDIWDPLGRVFDVFGFDRCMWGTDWTRRRQPTDL
jgi:hypothetical protein